MINEQIADKFYRNLKTVFCSLIIEIRNIRVQDLSPGCTNPENYPGRKPKLQHI